MTTHDHITPREIEDDALINGRDVARWLTFSAFWGSVSYLLASASLISASRTQPARVNSSTATVALGVHVVSFVALGAASSAASSLIRRKPTTAISEEQIGSGRLEQPKTIIGQSLGAALGAIVPLGIAVASQMIAERIVGEPAIGNIEDIRWPHAVVVMSGLSALTALGVARITGWVARDARTGNGEEA